MNTNPREGSTLKSFFEDLGEWEEVEALAQKKIIAETLRREMAKQNVTKSELAKRMETSRSQLDAILDGEDPGLTLVSLSRASFALGLRPEIRFTPREVSRPPPPRAKTRSVRAPRRPSRASAASGRSAG
jgi:transcriptional regulator with XRE-family HTH domain